MVKQAVLLTGGMAKRLGPITHVTNKHLLPVFDKPMVYHGLELLKDLGIEEVTIVLGGNSVGDIVNLLKDGARFDIHISYVYQTSPIGISAAILLAEKHITDPQFLVLLGDNIFIGNHHELLEDIEEWSDEREGALIVLSISDNPQNYGQPVFKELKTDLVTGLDYTEIVDFIEKPRFPEHKEIVAGLYGFPRNVFDIIRKQKKSLRGEYEITDTLKAYIPNILMSEYDGFWTDCGTPEGLVEASHYLSKEELYNVNRS